MNSRYFNNVIVGVCVSTQQFFRKCLTLVTATYTPLTLMSVSDINRKRSSLCNCFLVSVCSHTGESEVAAWCEGVEVGQSELHSHTHTH